MSYQSINTQEDLDSLNNSICWEDSTLVESYIRSSFQSYFPSDTQLSGLSRFNYHCLYRVCSAEKSHLEIIFIGVEAASHHIITDMYLSGHVFSGGYVELRDYKKNTTLRCARIIFRFLDITHESENSYFNKPGILDYPTGQFIKDGYWHTSDAENHLLVSDFESGLEVIISDSSNHSQKIHLTQEQVKAMADVLIQSLQNR